VCFFFQAEDGIRDRNVTGVQTCALPISIFKLFAVLIEPSSTETCPKIIFKKDDLPVPLSPMIATCSPLLINIFTFSNNKESYALATFSISMTLFETRLPSSSTMFIFCESNIGFSKRLMRFKAFSILLARRYIAALGGFAWLAHNFNCLIDSFIFLIFFCCVL